LLLIRPMLATARWLVAQAAEPARVKRRLIAVGVGTLAFLALVPLPAGIAADGIVEASRAHFVFPPRDVRVVAVAARVAGSAAVLRLEAPDLVGERARVAALHAEALERWRRAIDSPETGSAQAAAEAADGAGRTLAGIDAEIARLTVAAEPGWDPLDAGDYAGAWVAPDRTRPLAVAIRPGAMRLHALVSEADAEGLRSGSGDAVARIAGRADRRFAARITRIDREARDTLPATALGRPGGGAIAVDPADPSGRRAETPLVSVWLAPTADAPALRHGQRIELRLGAPPRPALWQAAVAAARWLETPVAQPGGNGL
jgi:putative peptide zinc metalloprotease protein